MQTARFREVQYSGYPAPTDRFSRDPGAACLTRRHVFASGPYMYYPVIKEIHRSEQACRGDRAVREAWLAMTIQKPYEPSQLQTAPAF